MSVKTCVQLEPWKYFKGKMLNQVQTETPVLAARTQNEDMWVSTCIKTKQKCFLHFFYIWYLFWSHTTDFALQGMADKWHKNATHQSLSHVTHLSTCIDNTSTPSNRRRGRRWADVASRRNSSDWRSMDSGAFLSFYFLLSSTSGDIQALCHSLSLLAHFPPSIFFLLVWQRDDKSMGLEYMIKNDSSVTDTHMASRLDSKCWKSESCQCAAHIR